MDQNEVLLVASRGLEAHHGLWQWKCTDSDWNGRQIDTVRQLSSLSGHPRLPVVYGTAGVAQEGTLHAWRIDEAGEVALSAASSQGAEPCHLVVDPSGRLLIATNYTSSTLALQPLASDGSFLGPLALVKLSGGGPEIDRQDDAHPHQVFFLDETLIVIDLGADLIREFHVDFEQLGSVAIREVRTTPVPAGSGPRHGVVLPDGRLAISGELGENLLTGHLGCAAADWANVRSTRINGPARSRWERNYPGDIRRSEDGRHVYFANRSHNTLATFDVSSDLPSFVAEIDTTVNWPQHILVRPECVMIAGWDSSLVVALELRDGVPQQVKSLFECEGAGWLHAHRMT
ncbi:beta-propeller fold lactonase family protein [Devosia rhodophyticola]|uniref:Beta-propeller fold lactonase family protein n=1 Tax=Devosia rhodophyticola TaxID=3026423 RepID=A0ABY7YTN1_9HYPH|nr:beta-propeller fold lactonase family protein [Devosia rhodophyticola]WDR04746.1 beta-propeller fold lactonase family protein [Devosia rhodophyticola]